jgi:hypothetical protein
MRSYMVKMGNIVEFRMLSEFLDVICSLKCFVKKTQSTPLP